MKRRNAVRRNGAVLLMILGLMAMFALSVLSYMIITSNMAETAQTAQKIDSVQPVPVQSDLDYAIKNVLVGSDNEANPIGPFSILENMYGDWKIYDSESVNSTVQFGARIAIIPSQKIAVLTPDTLFNNSDISTLNDSDCRSFFTSLFENSGNVLTFRELGDLSTSDETFSAKVVAAWNSIVQNTSARVLDKVVTNPTNSAYNGNNSPDGDYWLEHYNDGVEDSGNKNYYGDFDFWHFKIDLSEDLLRFVNEIKLDSLEAFNHSSPVVTVRLNRPAFSGTGVGGFSPGIEHDAAIAQWMNLGVSAEDLRVPYAFWANAAAPDFQAFQRFQNSGSPSFRTLWAHLIDVSYDPAAIDDNGGIYNALNNPVGINRPVTWGYNDNSAVESPRLNPSYTAPDARSLFLAQFQYSRDDSGNLETSFTPSFHRPSLFQTLCKPSFGSMSYLDFYSNSYKALGSNYGADALVTGVIRRLTPRPLPYDHWNFSGGNAYLDYWRKDGDSIHNHSTDLHNYNVIANIFSNVRALDVDNDGDGERDGVWTPSGLPIRYDQNGTPYATMFSYLILDMDGRVNVNTAGNWDQLPYATNPHAYGAGGYYEPYYYLKEYDDVLGLLTETPSYGEPFYYPETPNFGWLDDNGNDISSATASAVQRGEGRGTSGVVLYEGLQKVFNSFGSDDVRRFAAQLMWRRYKSKDENFALPNVDGGTLSWGQNGIADASGNYVAQPGLYANGSEADDALGTREKFFRYIDPIRLYDANYNSDTLTIAQAKVRFPWRGKTTVDNMGANANLLPAFDFADTAFRSYDPLGNQVFTYAPRFSNNPYLAYQNVRTFNDSAYTITALERLLRSFDADAVALPNALASDLGMTGDAGGNFDVMEDRNVARHTLTTISSDVPAISAAFPENFVEDGSPRFGNYGFVDLIRRNVRSELKRVFEAKGICAKDTVADVDASGNPISVDVEGTNLYLDGNELNTAVFERIVEKITQYLVSMLPKEILRGEKIDLNALAQKNYWVDVDYVYVGDNAQPSDSLRVDASGDFIAQDDTGKNYNRDLHNAGLVKRMEYARGLYIVMMTLLYEDMNGKRLYDPDGNLDDEDATAAADPDSYPNYVEQKLSNYIEGSFDLLRFEKLDKKDEVEDLMARELMATRIAQWCVNVVDFSDPDATMTPFFFDPTPFDGWWVKDYAWLDGKTEDSLNVNDLATVTSTDPTSGETTVKNKWKGIDDGVYWNSDADPFVNFLFSPNQGLVTDQMFDFFKDALDNSEKSNGDISCYVDFNGVGVGDVDEATGAVTRYLPSNELIARWASRKIDDLHDQSTDLGFRVVWGMERPDLVLTETLNFHDLGIADTNLESDGDADVGYVKNSDGTPGEDENFDQVKRPQGSTYMEFYCTANPNTPQSPELYDYDEGKGLWRLRLSKTTPVYIDSQNRELKMPVWRVAISDSSDPRALNVKKNDMSEEDAKELAKSKDVVYRKAFNSVLNRLTPRKDGDKYLDDFSFFSMQPRQFRNLPTPTTSTKINSIADLDLDQGLDTDDKVKEPDASYILDDWKPFNLYASNVLGPAVAAEDEDARVKEVELDRILWFTHPKGDAVVDVTNLGTAGEYPDALRTFGRENDGTTYLSPNQYLVVGPATKRSIGSASYQSSATNESDKKFGQDPSTTESFIDLADLGKANLGRNYETMVAVANIGGQGLNISEPLWTSKVTDPYYAQSEATLKGADPTDGRIKVANRDVRDIPFEMPNTWGDREDFDRNNDGVVAGFYKNRVENYPIVQDELFGVGTVPGYKSAFVQRVADPNRPYHPLMNPYITVDWNMMDLTVFTGENASATLKAEIEGDTTLFTRGDDYPFKDKVNKIQFARNTALGFDDDDANKTYELEYKTAFSSRQWGSESQKTFAPGYSHEKRPNIWARAFKSEGNKAGLEAPREIDFTTGASNTPVVCRVPRHTFGYYNNIGAWGSWGTDADGNETFTEDETGGNTYRGLDPNYMNSGDVYTETPSKPFETLVWNDAPFGNPYEVMTVPASSAGRFGLEFIRNGSDGVDLSKLYRIDGNKKGSLGSFGLFGFDDWYTDKNIKVNREGDEYKDDGEIGKLRNKAGAQGVYLNFYASSKKAGDCLNLCRFLDFVTVPSPYLGSKKLVGYGLNGKPVTDEYGNPEFRSTMREPGKINLNTASEAALNALSPLNDRSSALLPGTPWQDFLDSRYPYETRTDSSGNTNTVNSSFAYFQPAHAANLWIQMDGTKPPFPAYATLLAPETCDLANNSTTSSDSPTFDSISQAYETDDAGNVIYSYEYIEETTGERASGETSDLDWLEDNMRVVDEDTGNTTGSVLSYNKKKTQRPGNLFAATAEAQRLSGLTTNKSNVFAVWVTVGYFEVERCNPGVNMPKYDPDGNEITLALLADPNYRWYKYYQAVYPDGYTYGKELGSDYGETRRHRGFSIIDRSIPVDYRRGSSLNWEKAVLVRRVID